MIGQIAFGLFVGTIALGLMGLLVRACPPVDEWFEERDAKRKDARGRLHRLIARRGDMRDDVAWLRVFVGTRSDWYVGKRLRREIEVVLAEVDLG